MKHQPPRRWGVVAAVVALVLLACLQIQYHHLKVDLGKAGFASATQENNAIRSRNRIRWGPDRNGAHSLPRGIVHRHSDMSLRPLWEDDTASTHKNKNSDYSALLAMAVGISQIKNIDTMARKFLKENYAVMLFHYDGNVDGWRHLEWSDKAIHILAHNQTKWWFAKRFLHPDVMAIYDFIFLWDEDLGVENFNPRRFLITWKAECDTSDNKTGQWPQSQQ
ncbi:lysine ketoglutarate reductase trans-splicing-like protein [Zea mays]|uniref:Lysine ketoglutarate reductase trans-splicing-like protein n=1 Tax=Zea mays TaxID=4577 RepID=A0A1D6GX95_MAIZE|nr:lysine ketoglutarate reductase trans-splicing-like protein [Zea mays]